VTSSPVRLVEAWADEVALLGGAAPLRSYRDLKVGTLDLEAADTNARRALLDGEPVAVSRLFPHDPLRSSSGRSARAIHERLELLRRGPGLAAGWLALGLATWHDPFAARRPAAPVLIRALRTAAGPDGEPVLTVTGPPTLNPVLLETLADDLGLRLDPAVFVDADGLLRYPVVVERLREAAPSHVVDGFAITHRAVVLVATPEPALVARRLSTRAATVAADPLVRALADAGVVPEAPAPLAPPANPVLDLDADQAAVVTALLADGRAVAHTPPGTGAVQTAVAAAAAVLGALPAGARVAMVAESAAVRDRLRTRCAEAGLGPITEQAPRQVPLPVDGPDAQRSRAAELPGLVERLARARAALHAPRAPWEVSAAQALVAGMLADGWTPEHRLSGEELAGLDTGTVAACRSALATFVDLGGLRIAATTTPWFGAAPPDEAAADDALARVRALREDLLPPVRDLGTRAAAEVGLPAPTDPGEAKELATLLSDVADAEERFGAGIWQEPLDRLVAATGDRTARRDLETAPGLTERRRLRADASRLAQRPDLATDRARLHAALDEARQLRQRWVAACRDGRLPRRGPSTEAFVAAVARLQEAFEAVDQIHPRAGLQGLDFAAAASRLDELAADGVTVTRLPALTAAAQTLADAGLGPLVAEMRDGVERGVVRDGTDAVAALARCRAVSLAEHLVASDPTLAADPMRDTGLAAAFRASDVAASWVAAETLRGRVDADTPAILVDGPVALSARCDAEERFDLLVVVAAHAVPVAHVVELLARADRLVVLGDPRGPLPAGVHVDLDRADAGDVPPPGESVLEAAGRVLPVRSLTHQHRLRHELLALPWADPAASAALSVAPGADDHGVLAFRHVVQPAGLKGQEDSVEAEAEVVVDLLVEQVRARRDESVAVLTLGVAHAETVRRALARRCASTVGLAAELAGRPDEPLVVLAVEELRGETRDSVIVSVGVGRTLDGRLLYRFGPLNQPGGHRWLVALTSRARARLTVVSSLRAEDLDVRRLAADGPRRLRELLAFVETGGAERPASAGGRAADPLRDRLGDDVARRLSAAGLPVGGPVGTGAFSVPVTVRHPRRPGRGVLAIDTDATTVADLRTRERLLPEALARRGWSHVRVSAVQWLADPDAEITRIMALVGPAVAASDRADAAEHGPAAAAWRPAPASDDAAGPGARGAPAAPSVPTGRAVATTPPADLVALAGWLDRQHPDLDEGALVAALARVTGAADDPVTRRRLEVAVRAAVAR
jgi:hypothetical protein